LVSVALLLEVINHALDRGFEVLPGFESHEFSDLFDIRTAPAHVLDDALDDGFEVIGGLVGDESFQFTDVRASSLDKICTLSRFHV
jgi:hypothetical protein